MNGSILWKCVLSAAVLAWSVLNLIPVKDTLFGDYIQAQATAKDVEFAALLARVGEHVKTGDYPTEYVALSKIIEAEKIDLVQFFPDINVHDIKNLGKRNSTLLQHLLQKSQGKVRLGLDLQGGVAFTFKVNENDLAGDVYERQEQLAQAVNIMLDRVDAFGVAEPIVRLKGENGIEVQMPGISTRNNPDVVDTLKAPAKLEFSTVHRTISPAPMVEAPLGYFRMAQEIEDPKTGRIYDQPYFVKRVPLMTGEIIREAFAAANEFGGYRILLRFTSDGDDQFARVTREIAQENQRTGTIGQLAIILDGTLYSAPSVREEIRGGAEITGRFSQREAVELANVLNNPLEVGLELDEMYEVGPSLAADSRDASLLAGYLGAALVVVFMIFIYRVAGIVAVAAVVLNIVFVVGTLASFGATVTLPGVAALVLTIGMAVDANILIFERIREELRFGKTLHTSLVSGYDKALSTIVDANVTTLITASILIWLGTGPVKGFGVTLAIGILASMFCALVVTRWILELLVNLGIVRRLMVLQLLKPTDYPFLNLRKSAPAISVSIVVLGIVYFASQFDNVFGIDFLGGDEITVNFQEKLSSRDIESIAAKEGLGEVTTLYQRMIGTGTEVLKIQTGESLGAPLFSALQQQFPDAGLDLVGESRIGASVSGDVKTSAFVSVGVALFGILLYVALRFEIGYGIGAVVATVHDVLMTIGIYVLLGQALGWGSGQFTAPMIAAILMIVGYSINDTIVVFDRIREELTLNPDLTLRQVVDMSINRTLSRTVLTSVTTLLATSALYIFGAGIVNDFALVFIIGIFTGTFSSIFIASPVFFWWHKGDRRHVEERHDVLPKYDWESTTRAAR